MRKFEMARKTKETDIICKINLDGTGQAEISTGVGFFDHMLMLMTFHSSFDINLSVTGDLNVDDHHTVEDTGIVIGGIIKSILGDRSGIERYGYALVPMDEVLCRAVIDISGRFFCRINPQFNREYINNFATENVLEFLNAFTREAAISLHVDILVPGNTHHQVEAIFKAVGIALKMSVKPNLNRLTTSTKSL